MLEKRLFGEGIHIRYMVDRNKFLENLPAVNTAKSGKG